MSWRGPKSHSIPARDLLTREIHVKGLRTRVNPGLFAHITTETNR